MGHDLVKEHQSGSRNARIYKRNENSFSTNVFDAEDDYQEIANFTTEAEANQAALAWINPEKSSSYSKHWHQPRSRATDL
jgi:hypothetical protein